MVEETACTCKQYLSTNIQDKSGDQQVKTFHSLVLQRKLWTLVQWIMEREKCRILELGGACSNTGKSVMDMLWLKNTEYQSPLSSSLDA